MKITRSEHGETQIVLNAVETTAMELRGVIEYEGFRPSEAAHHALSTVPKKDPLFVQYLSVGALALVDGVVETMPYGRPS
jgi:hypothetical protein